MCYIDTNSVFLLSQCNLFMNTFEVNPLFLYSLQALQPEEGPHVNMRGMFFEGKLLQYISYGK